MPLTYAADVTGKRLAAFVYVATPGVLILVWAVTDWGFTYMAALVIVLPLSLAANVASFVVAALVLPSVDSNGAPIAAVMMSGAALMQLLALHVLLRTWRQRRRGLVPFSAIPAAADGSRRYPPSLPGSGGRPFKT